MMQVLYPHLCNKQREKTKLYTLLKTEETEIDKGYFLNILPPNINVYCLNDRKFKQIN